jgi:UDP-perosamine 4-acetyltransferase
MNERPVYLLGAGGHGRVVLDALLCCGARPAGILDSKLGAPHSVFNIPVLGGDDWLDRINPADVVLAIGVGANPHLQVRQELFEMHKKRGFDFLTLRHPSAILGRDSQLGEGCQIMAGAVLQCRVSVAKNAVVNTRASIDHDCHIGAHAFISPGAVLCGEVRVGDQAFLGAGAVVLPGLEVGSRAIVGAGSVVVRSVGAGCVVAGNPARELNGSAS